MCRWLSRRMDDRGSGWYVHGRVRGTYISEQAQHTPASILGPGGRSDTGQGEAHDKDA